MTRVFQGFFAKPNYISQLEGPGDSSFKTAAARLSASGLSPSVAVELSSVKIGQDSKQLSLTKELVELGDINTPEKCVGFLRDCALFAQAKSSESDNVWFKANVRLATLQYLAFGKNLATLYEGVGDKNAETVSKLNGSGIGWRSSTFTLDAGQQLEVLHLLAILNQWPLYVDSIISSDGNPSEPKLIVQLTDTDGAPGQPVERVIQRKQAHVELRRLITLAQRRESPGSGMNAPARPSVDADVSAAGPSGVNAEVRTEPLTLSVLNQISDLNQVSDIAPQLRQVSISGQARFHFLKHFSLYELIGEGVLNDEGLTSKVINTMLQTRFCLAGLNHEGKKVGLDARSKLRYQQHMSGSILGMVRYLFSAKRAPLVESNIKALNDSRELVLNKLQGGGFGPLGMQARALLSAMPSHLLSPSAFAVWLKPANPLEVIQYNSDGSEKGKKQIRTVPELMDLCNSRATDEKLVLTDDQLKSLKEEAEYELRGLKESETDDIQDLSAIPTFKAHYKDEYVVYEARQLQPGLRLAELSPRFLRGNNFDEEKSENAVQALDKKRRPNLYAATANYEPPQDDNVVNKARQQAPGLRSPGLFSRFLRRAKHEPSRSKELTVSVSRVVEGVGLYRDGGLALELDLPAAGGPAVQKFLDGMDQASAPPLSDSPPHTPRD